MKKGLIVLAAVLSVVFGGCVTKDTSGIVVEKDHMVVYNARFASHITMEYQLKRTTESGFIQVQSWIQNADSGDIRFQYRFEWLDKDGMLICESNPTWHVATVHGRDRLPLEGVSETRRAADFRLVVRPL